MPAESWRRDGRRATERPPWAGAPPLSAAPGETMTPGAADRPGPVMDALEPRLDIVIDAVPEAVVVIGPGGAVEQLNREAERLFGCTGAEVLGLDFSVLVPPRASGLGAGGTASQAASARRTITFTARDGRQIVAELTVGSGSAGGRSVLIALLRDVSGQRYAEIQLREFGRQMAHVSRMNALGQMGSTLAHELNQPLTAAGAFAEASCRLLDRSDAASLAKARQAAASVAGQVARAGQIVRRLRESVTRGDTDRGLEDLREVIEEAAALALTGAREAGVMVRLSLGHQVIPVLIDRVQVQQVLLNLIRNAVEAVSAAAWKEVELTVDLPASHDVVVGVCDTGRGVPPHIAAELFSPFVSDKPEGMGIGLAISRTIINAHGGRIWAEPRAGGGTVFRFSLPLAGDVDEE